MKSGIAGAAVLIAFAASSLASAEPPLSGCYERTYGTAHLLKHNGQLVTRATLTIAATKAVEQIGADPIIADGTLRVWVRGEKQSFDSIGACRAEGKGLLCAGSLSAAEAETCRSKRDGVHECRIDSADPGYFSVEGRPVGILVSMRERLELVPAPYDGGPFLYLSPSNAENHAFLLRRTACK